VGLGFSKVSSANVYCALFCLNLLLKLLNRSMSDLLPLHDHLL
jgi:hypothetical protein